MMMLFRTIVLYSILLMVVALFFTKVKVQKLSQELKNIEARIQSENEYIHILRAELAYLSKPQRIEKLASKYLSLQFIQPEQIINIKNIKPGGLNE